MKKIVFFVQWMLCGGVENALISLSKELQQRGNDVTICLIESYGEFIDKISDGITIKEIPMPDKVRKCIPVGGTKVSVRRAIAEKNYSKALYLIFMHKVSRTGFAELNIDFREIPLLNEKYDIAVNFHIHSPFLVKYLNDKVTAKRKLTWIHNDFSTTGYKVTKLKKYLGCVNQFFCVSEQLMREFIGLLPEYKEVTQVAHNIVSIDDIRKRAEAFYPDEYKRSKELRILTVGRLEEQKGYNLAIMAAKMLRSKGLNFQWYVLGNGTLYDKLKSDIEKAGIKECFHLLGVRMNPYPYFKHCDIYVQTSLHEGWGLTLSEAKAFYKPILTTDFAGAREQIIDGVTGDIAQINAMSIYQKLDKLIKDIERRNKYIITLQQYEKVDKNEWIDAFC